jgi:predicted metalloprotease
MRKMMPFTVTLIISLTFLMTIILSTAGVEQNRKQAVEQSRYERMHFFGSKTEFSNSTEITEADVRLMWEKVQLGITIVDQFWREKFAQNGLGYRRPQVKYYTSPVNTSCGEMEMNNAAYCPRDHTIYFDAIFFTRLMKGVGDQLGTDGDMAIIFVLAHEWGHAAQGLTGTLSNNTTTNETNADCTAGAFTLYAYQKGWLEKGDIEEVSFTISNFGDDLPWGITHGDPEERLLLFKRGIKKGLAGCGSTFSQ